MNLYSIGKSAYKYIWSYIENLKKPVVEVSLVIDKKYFIEQDVFDYPDDKEYWKDIKGYEGRYKISNHGNVYTCQLNKIMAYNKNDYLRVKLFDSNNKAKTHIVHVIVAKHFIKNPKNLSTINHIDHNKHNPHYKNLEWCTASDNSKAYHNQKPKLEVIQYNLDNKIIKEWKSIDEILENNKNYTRNSILSCLNNSVKSRYGFIWQYKNPPVKIIKNSLTIVDNIKEEWKNVGIIDNNDFSLYEISNYGRVKNTNTKLILSPGLSTTGY